MEQFKNKLQRKKSKTKKLKEHKEAILAEKEQLLKGK